MQVRDITFEPIRSDSLRLTITAVTEDGTVEEIVRQQQGGSVDDWGIDLAVRSVESILDDEPTRIVRLWHPVCWLVSLPEDDSTVQIDIRDYEPETDDVFPAESSYLDVGPLYMDKERLVESIIEWCRGYLDEYGEGDQILGYDIRPFEQQLTDAEEMFAQSREQGTLAGYQPTRPDELVEEYLFERSYDDPAMQEYVLESGALEEQISQTLASDDAWAVEDRIAALLSKDTEIAARTLELIGERPEHPEILYSILTTSSHLTDGIIDHSLEVIAALDTEQARAELRRLVQDPPDEWSPDDRVKALEEFARCSAETARPTLEEISTEADREVVAETAERLLRKRFD